MLYVEICFEKLGVNMKTKLETIILRFRDLSITDTIKSHKDIIESKEYVWWGWWAKPQEKVPINEFNQLDSHIEQLDFLDLFLFDSGKLKLYKARCTEIYYHNGKVVETPDVNTTPEYYRNNNYKAWFKFSDIEEIEERNVKKVLNEYSYLQVDDFFTSGQSSFTKFYNKQVFSLKELHEQQRTIWFLRKYEKGDRSHEIHSYENDYITEELDHKVYRVLESNELLWVSDLHFSEQHHAFSDFPGDKNRLSIRLNNEIDKKCKDQPSFLIISGDLTYKADKEEFDSAISFMRDMNSIYKINSKRCAIVPGNHDIAFSDRDFDEKKPVMIAFDEAKAAYTNFYREYYGIEPQEKLFSIHRFLSNNLQPIEIICLNSCLLQQNKGHFQGMGFVGNDQMEEVQKHLKATENSRIFRILVMHHHLLPVMFKEKPEMDRMYSMMLDSEAINQFIVNNKIRLILHGHTHKEFYSEIIRKKSNGEKHKYYIVGLGSTGVTSEELSESRTNMFAIISIEMKEIIIRGYSIYPDGEDSKLLFEHNIPIEFWS